MGGFSIWHGIILLLALAIPATLVGLVIWLAVRASGRSARAATQAPAVPPSTAARLQELAALKSQELITEAEYERKRAALLQDL